MKKLFYILFLLPFAVFTSCDKDNDLAPFDLTITMSGVTYIDGTFFTVAGETVSIDNFQAKAVGDKNTQVANVNFFLDNALILPQPWDETLAPFSFSTEGFQPGIYTIGVSGNLLQVDSSIKNFTANYKFVIVDSEDDLPAGAPELGTYSSTINYTK